MKLTATLTKEGLVFAVEDEDTGETMEVGPVNKVGYARFMAAVDTLDEVVSTRSLGVPVVLAERDE